jgi:hypothetical protein
MQELANLSHNTFHPEDIKTGVLRYQKTLEALVP